MITFFVSDVHLCDKEPKITSSFLSFLNDHVAKADALYILGDLFEKWIGDDDPCILNKKISEALKKLNQLGISCSFIHGNRDFLLGKQYASACGMTLLSKQKVIELFGHKIVILHGDTLCTEDIGYLRFRRLFHQRWLQKLFLLFPFTIRLRIFDKIRTIIMHINSKKSTRIVNINPKTVIEVFNTTGASVMIHGHTHQPAIHKVICISKKYQRITLGSWHHQGSAIKISNKGIKLIEFSY